MYAEFVVQAGLVYATGTFLKNFVQIKHKIHV